MKLTGKQRAQPKLEKACEHQFKTFRQTITPDNPKYDHRHSETYLVIRACMKCKLKITKDLVMR